MPRDFLGTGWSYPVETDHKGDIEQSSDIEKVEESIRIIIGTAPGERTMRPDFGCEIHEYVFASVDLATLTLMENAVEDALQRWEPRITIDEVDAERDQSEPNRIRIGITYRIRSTNSSYNMVYPFYLNQGEE